MTNTTKIRRYRESRAVNPRDEIDAIQTTLLRTLASPHRLRIIHLLGERPREVHEIARLLEVGQAAASQHLASMRSVGLVESVRDGRSVRYQLVDEQILVACGLMRDVIVRRLSALGSIAAAASRDPGASIAAAAPMPETAPMPAPSSATRPPVRADLPRVARTFRAQPNQVTHR
jgi:ArsR family transcriptional regulator, virulence genes transcriptional regulator